VCASCPLLFRALSSVLSQCIPAQSIVEGEGERITCGAANAVRLCASKGKYVHQAPLRGLPWGIHIWYGAEEGGRRLSLPGHQLTGQPRIRPQAPIPSRSPARLISLRGRGVGPPWFRRLLSLVREEIAYATLLRSFNLSDSAAARLSRVVIPAAGRRAASSSLPGARASSVAFPRPRSAQSGSSMTRLMLTRLGTPRSGAAEPGDYILSEPPTNRVVRWGTGGSHAL